jgi:hypothetical protein
MIVYRPDREVGAQLDKIVGDDKNITYKELKDFLINNPEKPVFGRGRIGRSGPGDTWTWNLLMNQGELGEAKAPQKSIDWVKPLYESNQIKLYEGSSPTFKALNEGSVDVIPHLLGWYFRLYSLGLVNDKLPEHLKVDSFGLEKTKWALMSGEGVISTTGGHYYMIPSNLDDEKFKASMEFMKMAITPEVNSASYTSLMQPTYETSSFKYVTDKDIQTVWNEVKKHYPKEFLVQKDGEWELGIKEDEEVGKMVKDVNLISIYLSAWQDQLEANY